MAEILLLDKQGFWYVSTISVVHNITTSAEIPPV